MINVRVRIWRDDKELWTSAIRDPQALASLLPHLQRCGIKSSVYDDFGHSNVADGCLAIAERSHTLHWYTWGKGNCYGCWLAPVPRAEGKLSWENCQADPRELTGPLPEEVAEHTPCACCDADMAPSNVMPVSPAVHSITAFDVHGMPERPTPPPAAVTVQPQLSPPTWWDRVLQLITGTTRGEAVRGQ
jgi:hypothetical protein